VNKDSIATVVMAILFGVMGLTIGGRGGWNAGYQQGQIDALTGHPRYHLTTQPNGETLWVETKEEK
jgi:hypothetical protein